MIIEAKWNYSAEFSRQQAHINCQDWVVSWGQHTVKDLGLGDRWTVEGRRCVGEPAGDGEGRKERVYPRVLLDTCLHVQIWSHKGGLWVGPQEVLLNQQCLQEPDMVYQWLFLWWCFRVGQMRMKRKILELPFFENILLLDIVVCAQLTTNSVLLHGHWQRLWSEHTSLHGSYTSQQDWTC